MDLGIKGRCALVTGGSRGIGRAIAMALAKEGCNVFIAARGNEDLLKTTWRPRVRGAWAAPIQADLATLEGVDELFRAFGEFKCALHILVNNVGGGGRWGDGPVEQVSEEVWNGVYAKNALAAVRCTMRAIPLMLKHADLKRVVTIASIYGREAGGRPWFNMAKSAEIALMKSLSQDRRLVEAGLTFNTVAPGHIKVDKPGEEDWPGPWGQPEDVAAAVMFLCSQWAKHINGACLAVDGGESKGF